jgi:hypothetical protein
MAHLLGELDTLVDRHIVLDLHPVADDDVLVDEDVLTQRAAGPDHRAPAHLAVMPDHGAVTYQRVIPEPPSSAWCCGTGWRHPFNVLVFQVTVHLCGLRVITAS